MICYENLLLTKQKIFLVVINNFQQIGLFNNQLSQGYKGNDSFKRKNLNQNSILNDEFE